MIRRAKIAAAVATIATVIWLIAFVAYDRASRQDAWQTYRSWCEEVFLSFTPVLLSSICVFSILTSLLILKWQLLPGRLVSAFIIGLLGAALILPGTTRDRRGWIARDRFAGFKESTVQYLAFCVPIAVGFLVASRRDSLD